MKNGHSIIAFCLVICASVWLASCGNDASPDYQSAPPPATDAAFDAIKPVIAANCAKCHNGTTQPLVFSSAAVFKGSKAKARLTAGTMPPGGNIDADSKQKLLAYLNQ